LSRVATLDWWGGAYSGASYGFSSPHGVAFDGAHLWITNLGGNSVTEIDPANGALVRVVSGAAYDFSSPQGIAFDGAHLWVVSLSSVTEVNPSDGPLVRALTDASYGFSESNAIALGAATYG
jgi:DNA-binding beta-propeller fold protein YncE